MLSGTYTVVHLPENDTYAVVFREVLTPGGPPFDEPLVDYRGYTAAQVEEVNALADRLNIELGESEERAAAREDEEEQQQQQERGGAERTSKKGMAGRRGGLAADLPQDPPLDEEQPTTGFYSVVGFPPDLLADRLVELQGAGATEITIWQENVLCVRWPSIRRRNAYEREKGLRADDPTTACEEPEYPSLPPSSSAPAVPLAYVTAGADDHPFYAHAACQVARLDWLIRTGRPHGLATYYRREFALERRTALLRWEEIPEQATCRIGGCGRRLREIPHGSDWSDAAMCLFAAAYFGGYTPEDFVASYDTLGWELHQSDLEWSHTGEWGTESSLWTLRGGAPWPGAAAPAAQASGGGTPEVLP